MLIRENLMDNSSEKRVVKAESQYSYTSYDLLSTNISKSISIRIKAKVLDIPPDNEVRILIAKVMKDDKTSDIKSNVLRLENILKIENISIPNFIDGEKIRIYVYACNPSKFIANKGHVEYSHLKVENGENSTIWIPSKKDLAVNLQAEYYKQMFGEGYNWTEVQAF